MTTESFRPRNNDQSNKNQDIKLLPYVNKLLIIVLSTVHCYRTDKISTSNSSPLRKIFFTVKYKNVILEILKLRSILVYESECTRSALMLNQNCMNNIIKLPNLQFSENYDCYQFATFNEEQIKIKSTSKHLS